MTPFTLHWKSRLLFRIRKLYFRSSALLVFCCFSNAIMRDSVTIFCQAHQQLGYWISGRGRFKDLQKSLWMSCLHHLSRLKPALPSYSKKMRGWAGSERRRAGLWLCWVQRKWLPSTCQGVFNPYTIFALSLLSPPPPLPHPYVMQWTPMHSFAVTVLCISTERKRT